MNELGIRALRQIVAQMTSQLSSLSDPEGVAGVVAQFEPLFARTFRDIFLASYLQAASETAASSEFIDSLQAVSAAPIDLQTVPGSTPVVRFPLIDEASSYLLNQGLLTRDQFDRLDQDARRAAFTIARINSVEAIGQIRNALVDSIETGGTLEEFREQIADAVQGSRLSAGQLEAIYRTQTAQAYSAGQREILSNPLVVDEFPYVMWSATHDSRVREDHLEMEQHGQNGTAVYRRDDPIWEALYPPAGWNCRCTLIPLSIEDAARFGSKEAKEWLDSGVPPLIPDFASRPYPITPPPGWPRHERIESVL